MTATTRTMLEVWERPVAVDGRVITPSAPATKRRAPISEPERAATHSIESILIATDFSEHARHALDRAALLADELALSKATLLHVASRRSLGAFWGHADAHEALESGAKRARELAGDIRARSGLRVEQRVVSGKVVPTIRELASQADLTIVGASAAHPLRALTVGSTVERLSRRIQQPMLVVARPARESYRQVLVAVDLSTDATNAMAYVRSLAPGAKLNLVHVYRAPYEAKLRYAGATEQSIYRHRAEAQMAAAAGMTDLVLSHLPGSDVRVLLAYGYAIPRLMEQAQGVGADLIVVTKRKPSLVRELLVESTTPRVLARSHCDVLVVP